MCTVPWLLQTMLLLLLGLLLPLPLMPLFMLPLLLPLRQLVCGWSCVLISLIISCVPSHARGEIPSTGNFTYIQTLVVSERFLIDDWGNHLYGHPFSAHRQDLRFGHVLDRATLEGQKKHVHTRFCLSNLAMGRHFLRIVKCRGDGNCGYNSLINEICHLRGQVRTNTAVSVSIFCQRCSTYVFYLRYFCFYTCMPLCTPLAQASVFVLVHYAKRHMDTCVEACWSLCVCARTLQERISCIVYSVFRRLLPCKPSTAHMCIYHRCLRNITLLCACTGHQIRAS